MHDGGGGEHLLPVQGLVAGATPARVEAVVGLAGGGEAEEGLGDPVAHGGAHVPVALVDEALVDDGVDAGLGRGVAPVQDLHGAVGLDEELFEGGEVAVVDDPAGLVAKAPAGLDPFLGLGGGLDVAGHQDDVGGLGALAALVAADHLFDVGGDDLDFSLLPGQGEPAAAEGHHLRGAALGVDPLDGEDAPGVLRTGGVEVADVGGHLPRLGLVLVLPLVGGAPLAAGDHGGLVMLLDLALAVEALVVGLGEDALVVPLAEDVLALVEFHLLPD